MKPTNLKARKPETRVQPHRGDARKMSAGDLREVVLARLDLIKGDVIDRVQGALSRNDQLASDLKDYVKFRESINKRLFDFAQRLAKIEDQMKWAIAAGIMSGLGPKKPAPAPESAPVPAEMPVFIQTRAPLPAWKKETKEAVSKLSSALPALVSIPGLATYFSVSYNKIRIAILKGQLAVTHQGDKITIPREAVAEYVRVYGVPRNRKLFYGSAGVVEHDKSTVR